MRRRRQLGVWLGLVALASLPFWQVADLQAANDPTNVEVNIWMWGAPDITPVKDLERDLGVTFDGLKWYEDWDDPWRPWIPNGYHGNGYIPEMAWQPMLKQPDGSFKGVANTDILDGQYDQYLDGMSANIKALPYRLRISYATEFNGFWNPWAFGKVGNTAENFKASWRYIVNRFKQNGVTNVDWIWAPNVDPDKIYPRYAEMYPGDAYVTYFGLDGYNFGTTGGGSWRSFRAVYQASYDELLAIANKDIYIMEVGSVEQGGSKAQWIKDMFDDLATRYPKIKGLTWWNVAYPQYDMRIQTSASSKAQFALSVNGRPSVPPATPGKTPTAKAPASGSVAETPRATPTNQTTDQGKQLALSPQSEPVTGFTLARRLDPTQAANAPLIAGLLIGGTALLTALLYGLTRRILASSTGV